MNTKRPFQLQPGDVAVIGGAPCTVSSAKKTPGADEAWSIFCTDDTLYQAHHNEEFEIVSEALRTDVDALDETKQVLWRMLTENTGRAMCDSGGAYGRHWERNQNRNFELMPEAVVEFNPKYGEISVTLNVYHWLAERLEYEPRIDDLYRTFSHRPSQKDHYDLQSMREFLPFLERFGFKFASYYNQGDPDVTNSYNSENALSQDIQFLLFNAESPDGGSESYVLLQIHNGCDVRGGYTRPRAFRVDTNVHGDETCMYDFGKLVLNCDGKPHVDALCPNRNYHLKGLAHDCEGAYPGEHHSWFSDDAGYTWRSDDDYRDNLKGEMVVLGNVDAPKTEHAPRTVRRWTKGLLCVTDNGQGLCPRCGGELSGGSY